MRSVIFLTCLLITGCTSPLKALYTTPDDAPAWYTGRNDEINKQGYIPLTDVPRAGTCHQGRPGAVINNGIQVSGKLPFRKNRIYSANRQTLLDVLQQFKSDQRATRSQENGKELQAWVERHRQIMPDNKAIFDPSTAGFLTDSDVKALKAIFDAPRGQP